MGCAKKSPWVIHYDGSSCNGCDIEVLAALCPGFDAERFGVINTGNPKHADIFLVTGSVNKQNADVIKQIYDQMVEPKVVAACGICACSGGIFRDCYNVNGGVDSVIPVDVYVPGCAVRPESIIDAVVKAIDALEQKSNDLKKAKKENRPYVGSLTSAQYAELKKQESPKDDNSNDTSQKLSSNDSKVEKSGESKKQKSSTVPKNNVERSN